MSYIEQRSAAAGGGREVREVRGEDRPRTTVTGGSMPRSPVVRKVLTRRQGGGGSAGNYAACAADRLLLEFLAARCPLANDGDRISPQSC